MDVLLHILGLLADTCGSKCANMTHRCLVCGVVKKIKLTPSYDVVIGKFSCIGARIQKREFWIVNRFWFVFLTLCTTFLWVAKIVDFSHCVHRVASCTYHCCCILQSLSYHTIIFHWVFFLKSHYNMVKGEET
jgi:hypothetical protein